jgi:release factor glutamine methyltransferase
MTAANTVGQVLRALPAEFAIDRLDARLLVEHVSGLSHAALIGRPETPLDAGHCAELAKLARRRAGGEPLAYLIGEAEFRGLRLQVSPAVLVPRPETELLVELALGVLQKIAAAAAATRAPLTVLDLGTGSGAIPLAIKHAFPSARVFAVDVSPAALAVARGNAERLNLPVEFIESDWYGNLPSGLMVDVLVSNPPYVAAGDPHLAGDGLRFEPVCALTDGADGLSALRQIVAGAPKCLKPGGWLMMEHGYDQAAAVRAMLSDLEAGSAGEAFGFCEVQSWRDLPGIERVSGGRLRRQP